MAACPRCSIAFNITDAGLAAGSGGVTTGALASLAHALSQSGALIAITSAPVLNMAALNMDAGGLTVKIRFIKNLS
jgi:hypothetical protein